MPTLIIAGTERGVGKTSLAAGLLVLLAGEGRSSAYYKPFSATADDADVRLEPFGPLAVILGPAPVTALPDASNMGDVSAAVCALRDHADTTIIELADGLDPADFAQTLDARVLMVLRYPADPVGEFSVTADALGERLAAAVVNHVPAYRADEAAAQAASARFAAPVVTLPESRFMLAPTVAGDRGAPGRGVGVGPGEFRRPGGALPHRREHHGLRPQLFRQVRQSKRLLPGPSGPTSCWPP